MVIKTNPARSPVDESSSVDEKFDRKYNVNHLSIILHYCFVVPVVSAALGFLHPGLECLEGAIPAMTFRTS